MLHVIGAVDHSKLDRPGPGSLPVRIQVGRGDLLICLSFVVHDS